MEVASSNGEVMTASTTATGLKELVVLPGEVWRVGPHILACGDLKDDGPLRLLDLVKEAPKLLYTDLPWSGSVAAYYRKSAGVQETLPFTQLLASVMRTANRVDGCAFLEVSGIEKNYVPVEAAVVAGGLEVKEHWDTLWNQFHGRLIRVKGSGHTHPDLPGSKDQHDKIAERCILTCTEEGDPVMDTCMGFGMVAMSAAKHGRRALGTELNPLRVRSSIQKLAAYTKTLPERIGQL